MHKSSSRKGAKEGTQLPSDFDMDSNCSFSAYEHAFMLRKLHKNCYLDTVIAEFMPQKSRDSADDLKKQNYTVSGKEAKLIEKNQRKYHAVYLKDGRHFTPAFIIGKDLKDCLQCPEKELQKFKEKVNEAVERSSASVQEKLWKPRPGGRKCQICKQEYEDYMQHIQQPRHVKLLHKSIGWKYQKQFIENYQKKRAQNQSGKKPNANLNKKGKSPPKKKSKKISKNQSKKSSNKNADTSQISVQNEGSDLYTANN